MRQNEKYGQSSRRKSPELTLNRTLKRRDLATSGSKIARRQTEMRAKAPNVICEINITGVKTAMAKYPQREVNCRRRIWTANQNMIRAIARTKIDG